MSTASHRQCELSERKTHGQSGKADWKRDWRGEVDVTWVSEMWKEEVSEVSEVSKVSAAHCQNCHNIQVNGRIDGELFDVAELLVEQLLEQWRWLVRSSVTIVARNNFADLFLREPSRSIWKLDVSGGTYSEIAGSEAEFKEQVERNLEAWFGASDEQAAVEKGLIPGRLECIKFKIPLVFAESGTPDNACIGDFYETVAFLGYIHQQVASLPDGATVRFKFK